MSLNPGSMPTQIGSYRLLGEIGRGGMGVVYRAERRDGSVIALKVMAPELAANEGFRERFTRESRLIIDHPHIVAIYDAGVADGQLYMAMYLVNGSDLKTLIRSEGRLLPARIVRLFTQAAAALDAAHANGVVHRDVKPQNFLIEDDGDGTTGTSEHVYLSDFGLVKRVTGQTSLTGSGHLVGTAQYMSPEQIRGRMLDGRTDVYALGCVLYECLTGSPPFTADEEVAILWGHVNEEAPRVSQRIPVLPEAVDAVVGKAMAKDPDHRYLTAGDLADDLAGVLDPSSSGGRSRSWSSLQLSLPPSATKTGARQRAVAPAEPRRASLGWVAAALMGVLVIGLVMTRGGDVLVPVVENLTQLPNEDTRSAATPADEGSRTRSGPRNQRAPGAATRLVERLRAGLPDTLAPSRERVVAGPVVGSRSTGTAADSRNVAPHPHSGTYTYSQTGHDRICPENRSCLSGSDLPDAQEVRVGQADVSTQPLIISSGRISRRFALASVIRYGYSYASLQDLHMSFDTEFGSFQVELDPQPSLRWLAFPFEQRDQWDGSWQSDTPGRYAVEVVRSGRVSVAGRRIEAVQVRTSVEWEGSHPGALQIVMWLARDSRLVLESAGHVRVATNVSDHHYEATFTTRLQHGPGH